MAKFMVHGYKLPKRLRPILRLQNASLTPHNTITKPNLLVSLFSILCPPFIHHHKKISSHTKRKRTQFEDTEQVSEPESGMVGMLELSNQEFCFCFCFLNYNEYAKGFNGQNR